MPLKIGKSDKFRHYNNPPINAPKTPLTPFQTLSNTFQTPLKVPLKGLPKTLQREGKDPPKGG